MTKTNSEGYKQVAKLTIYPAIPGKNKQSVQSAWAAIGGKDSFPCDDQAGLDGNTGIAIETKTSVFAVGTLQITNETPDFGSGNLVWDFIDAGGVVADAKHDAMGFGFSNGSQCSSLSSGTWTKPNFTSATWGPVPILIAYSGVVTPKTPNGDFAYVGSHPLGEFNDATIVDSAGKQGPIVITGASSDWLAAR